MDKSEALNLAKVYINTTGDTFEIKQAFLFGSYAKETQTEDSDIDIAIIIGDSKDIIDTQIDRMKRRRNVDGRIEPHPIKENQLYSTENGLRKTDTP